MSKMTKNDVARDFANRNVVKPTLTSQLQELAALVNGQVVFSCPNYGVVKVTTSEISLDGPAVRGWEKKNAVKIADLRFLMGK